MPRKLKAAATVVKELPSIPKELIDEFVEGPMSAEAIQSASMAFKKALIERALGAELGHHLGYPAGAERPEDATNHRNGKSGKTVLTNDGPLRLDISRNRDGSFVLISLPSTSAALPALTTRSSPCTPEA
jgi:putative transposase